MYFRSITKHDLEKKGVCVCVLACACGHVCVCVSKQRVFGLFNWAFETNLGTNVHRILSIQNVFPPEDVWGMHKSNRRCFIRKVVGNQKAIQPFHTHRAVCVNDDLSFKCVILLSLNVYPFTQGIPFNSMYTL